MTFSLELTGKATQMFPPNITVMNHKKMLKNKPQKSLVEIHPGFPHAVFEST